MLKLIVLDFDGTLVPRNFQDLDIDDETLHLIHLLLEKNIKFMIATGRHPSYIEKRIKKIRFETIVGYSGNITMQKNIIESYHFTKEIIQSLKQTIDSVSNSEMILYTDEGLACASSIKMQNSLYRDFSDTAKISDMNGVYEYLIDDYLNDEQERNICRICIRFDNLKERDYTKKILSKSFLNYRLIQTGVHQLEVMNNSRSKASEIIKITNELNIEPCEIVTIGDDENDYEMLKMFPYSYYVGTQNECLSKAATFTMKSCKEVLKKIFKEVGELNV